MTVSVVRAKEAGWDDLQAVLGTRGPAATCRCQRYKLAPREAFKHFPASERARRLRCQIETDPTSGLVAYADEDPAGWCAVEPRTAYPGLLRNYRVPWEGRSEDRGDDSVWAVTCVFVRAGFRGHRVAYALVAAAVEHAHRSGASALESYPMVATPGQRITWDEIHVGAPSIFAAAGFVEVHRPTPRRAVMRIDF